ncbi:hypothetical protein JXL19_07125, partial [bacterium]|nr:hypothetical protein [bacterium]
CASPSSTAPIARSFNPAAKSFTLAGIDGLYFYDNSLIAIQNLGKSSYVTQFSLKKDARRNKHPEIIKPIFHYIFSLDKPYQIESAKIIEASNPLFIHPTTGTFVDDEFFYYIANSQVECFNDDMTLFSMDKLKEPVILKISLKGLS